MLKRAPLEGGSTFGEIFAKGCPEEIAGI